MGTCKNRGKPLLGRDPLWLHSLVEKEQSLEQPTKSNVDEGPAVCILHFQHVRGWTIRVVANKIYIHADTTLPSEKCRWGHKLVDVVVAKKCRPMSSIHNQLASPKHLKYKTLQTIIIWNIYRVTYVPKYKIYNKFSLMIMTDFSRWHIPPDDRSSGRRWRSWPSSSTCRPALKTKHCKSGKSEFILSELRCIDGVLNSHCGLKHWNEQSTVKPWVENEQNMEERDNIANSDGEIKRGCACLLDHEDHHDRRVGVGNVSIFINAE